jgi:hypothetical protein
MGLAALLGDSGPGRQARTQGMRRGGYYEVRGTEATAALVLSMQGRR